MEILIAVLTVLTVTTCTGAAVVPRTKSDLVIEHRIPTRLEDVDADGGVHSSPGTPFVRNKRLTCDILSFDSSLVKPNHVACALKCMGTGKKGGHCEGTTCLCRRDKWTPW